MDQLRAGGRQREQEQREKNVPLDFFFVFQDNHGYHYHREVIENGEGPHGGKAYHKGALQRNRKQKPGEQIDEHRPRIQEENAVIENTVFFPPESIAEDGVVDVSCPKPDDKAVDDQIKALDDHQKNLANHSLFPVKEKIGGIQSQKHAHSAHNPEILIIKPGLFGFVTQIEKQNQHIYHGQDVQRNTRLDIHFSHSLAGRGGFPFRAGFCPQTSYSCIISYSSRNYSSESAVHNRRVFH